MKKAKVLNDKLKMTAVFVAGLAVATLGWWQSDRLNLAFGSEAGINEIRGGIAAPTEKCSPGDKLVETRRYDGCKVVVSVPRCNPNRRYIVPTKTKNGRGVTTFASPVKGSREEVSYEKVTEEKTVEFKSEYDRVSGQVESLKRSMPIPDLPNNKDYQDALKYKKELDTMTKRCMPVPTITKPGTTQKPVAR
jgi:hypothetical protein